MKKRHLPSDLVKKYPLSGDALLRKLEIPSHIDPQGSAWHKAMKKRRARLVLHKGREDMPLFNVDQGHIVNLYRLYNDTRLVVKSLHDEKERTFSLAEISHITVYNLNQLPRHDT